MNRFLRSSTVLLLKVRNKNCKVLNDTWGVCLAFEPEEIEEDLLWYCSQIQKDSLALNENVSSSSNEKKQFAKNIQGV